jgi:hypothetical protein
MVKKSPRLVITFFSLALAVFVVIQYCWIKSLQDGKLRSFRSRTISAITRANENILPATPGHKWSDTAIAAVLFQSFSSVGLGGIRFEFSTGPGDNHLASYGVTQVSTINSADLILYHPLRPDSQNTQGAVLTVVIRNWKRFALEGMGRIFAMCLGLTIMVIAVFCYALILNKSKQQLYWYNRADIVLDLVQQLEIPLSTMSVAVEALGNDKVMYHSEKRRFFQQAINEESRRMNEGVKKVFE